MVKRIYVEKKPEYASRAKQLRHEIRRYLGIMSVETARELIRYDVENIKEETFERALGGVFAEPPVDIVYFDKCPVKANEKIFTVEPLPGQFDQRADSATQCVRFLSEDENPLIRCAVTYLIGGDVTEDELAAIKAYCMG